MHAGPRGPDDPISRYACDGRRRGGRLATHPQGDKYVTVIIDLTPIRDNTGPARLLDLVEGRSKQAFKTWLEARTDQFRNSVQIVAMDGFTGFKTAAADAIPDAVAVMDPFHVVALAGDKLNTTRQRVQRELTGERGRRDDPLYKARRTLRTGRALLTDRQKTRLDALFTNDNVAAVEVTWLVYQDIIAAYPELGHRSAILASVGAVTCGDAVAWCFV